MKFNLFLSILHFSLAVFTGIYSENPLAFVPVGYFVVTSYPPSLPNATIEFLSRGTMNLGYMSSAFFAFTSFFHLINTYRLYNESIKENNPLRWVEYSITATLMLLIIVRLSGDLDFLNYLSISGVNIAMMCCGFFIEVNTSITFLNSVKKMNVLVFFIGCFFALCPWVPVFVKVATVVPNIPLVWGMIFVTFGSYMSFAFVALADLYLRGSSSFDYLALEFVYSLFSFIFKLALGLQYLFATGIL